jgi:potassium efflux system protein
VPTIERLKALTADPLLHFAGGPITIGSLLTGLLIVIVSYLVAGIVSRTVTRVLSLRKVAHGALFALTKMVRYVILFIGTLIAVTSIGIRLDALLAASTVVLVGVGLGLQNIAQNFVSGLILLIERPVATGDFVEIGQARGSVMDVGMRATRVVTRDEVTIVVPNSELISGQVINHSVPTTHLRIAVRVGIAYGTDTGRARDTLLAVARTEPAVLTEPAPEVRFDDFGESTLDLSLLVWIDNPREDLRIASRLRFAIDAAFRTAGIVLPFPQRDVHIIRA